MPNYQLKCWGGGVETIFVIDAEDDNDAILKAASRIIRIRRSRVKVYSRYELTDPWHKPVPAFQEVINNGG